MDLYQTLGVDRNATDSEIKKAYRKLSQRHHPDAGGSEEEFHQISEAYEILINPHSRHVYDLTNSIEFTTGWEVRIRKTIGEMFLKLVMTGSSSNYLDRMIKAIGAKRNELLRQVKDVNLQIGKLKATKGKITRKDGEASVFDHIIDEQVVSMESAVKEADVNLKFLGDVISELEHYEMPSAQSYDSVSDLTQWVYHD